ncbi:hypothetical protein HN51_062302, partial [Arachis hypogaea]
MRENSTSPKLGRKRSRFNSKQAVMAKSNSSPMRQLTLRTLLVLLPSIISPLYVYTRTFAEDIENSETNEEIFGTLSF